MTEAAKAARAEYKRQWMAKNREAYNAYQRQYRHMHPEKQKLYVQNYWERKAAEQTAAQSEDVTNA